MVLDIGKDLLLKVSIGSLIFIVDTHNIDDKLSTQSLSQAM